jgi:acetylornithine/succinyldiaminopimelate/putrescine aminotransferase
MDMTAEKMPLRESDWTVPVYAQLPVEPIRGDGVYLETRDGRRILDLYGGHAVACLGYGHPGLLDALRTQAETLLFQSNAVPMAVRAEACRALAEFAPEGLNRVFLVNSGAEANENALRLAFRVTGRQQVVAVEGAFHGRTGAAAAVTWGARERWYGYPRLPFQVSFVPPDDIEALTAAVTEDVAAVIVEPVQGVAGAVDMSAEFLAAAENACRACGALLIFDEVQCGMGRSGHPFVAQAVAVNPHVLTTAKGLAGGFPAGALVTTDEIADRLQVGDLGTTFGGGPMACAAISAVIKAILEENLMEQVKTVSERIRSTCVVGPVHAIQGRGLLLGLRTGAPARVVRDALLERDILAGTSGDPNILRLLPPLTLGEAEVDRLARALKEVSA